MQRDLRRGCFSFVHVVVLMGVAALFGLHGKPMVLFVVVGTFATAVLVAAAHFIWWNEGKDR